MHMMWKCSIALLLSTLRAAYASNKDRQLSSDDFARGNAIVHYELPWWHPEIHEVALDRISGPIDHPPLDEDTAFRQFMRANTGERHWFDGRGGLIQRPWMPRGHPNCDNYFIHEDTPTGLPSVHFDHPDIHEAYLNQETLPQGHPSVSQLLHHVLPEGHPDLDDLFIDHVELPSWHPDLSLLVDDNQIEPIFIFSGHPDVNEDLGEPIDDHPSIHHLFDAHLPSGHPDIDDLLKKGFTLPSWHPAIGSVVIVRSLLTSPGSILCFVVSGLLLTLMILRNVAKWKNSNRTREVMVTKEKADATSSESSDHSDHVTETKESGVEVIHNHDGYADLNPTEERILVYKEKKSTWKNVFGKRAGKGSVSTGTVVTCVIYLLANAAALAGSRYLFGQYNFAVGFGSLTAGNTVFTFVTATRNSIFTWFFGIAFDQVLVYHRFIGRLTMVVAVAHSGFYVNDIIQKTSDSITFTGLGCLGCAFIIFISSFNYVRRRFFNVFYWSHFSFIGFLVGMWLHASAARPYVAAAIISYGVDKLLQLTSKLPRRATVFEKMSDARTVHVQYKKSLLSKVFRQDKVGQYVFINFPALSLHEWHPFSIASGPKEAHVDLYIRALGDHTKKIVEYCEHCQADDKVAKIRTDGPYGSLPFNYQRYGSILFVAGGIGITPILSTLSDIYDSVGVVPSGKNRPTHCIGNISVIWVMPHASEASLFTDQLNSYFVKSLQDPLVPNLKLIIHATRDDPKDAPSGQEIQYSRPDFDVVMDEWGWKADGSLLVYACGPSGMVNQLWDASMRKNSKKLRVDFYHETFEF